MRPCSLRASNTARVSAFSLLMAVGFVLLCAVNLPVSLAKIKVGNFPKEAVAKYPLRTMDGREYSLAGLRGQVVVLDFVAVWCVHSRDHIPTLNRFDDEDRERGLKILGLIINDRETSQARVQQFVKDQKVEYPISMISQDLFERFIDSKDTEVPQTLVYGRNGRLAAHFVGHDATIDAQLTTVIKQELAKKN
jgi:thiol-disulfide isomerase/thioredoxin